MWLIIRNSDSAVVGTNYATQAPAAPNGHTVKEWFGPEPALHDPVEGVESYDPTLDDPDWKILANLRIDFDALADKADNEVAWLEAAIPQIETANLDELRMLLSRLMRQNTVMIKAWRYIVRRL